MSMSVGTKASNPANSSTAQPNGGPCAEAAALAPKVVGPNIKGTREEYQLVRRLQSALFGGVYEAVGLTSGRDFAVKVLHKSELSKAQETNSIEFCEVPLSELRFAELMRGDEHVMEPEDHFEDMYCFYVVFELAKGGDLLEALKQKPRGFDEPHAQYLIRQAARGLAFLHDRRVAMQDVSLENMLLHVDRESGNFQVKICDPGQAIIFEVDQAGEELPVNFRGLVGKSFRPPELHDQKPYCATKVDSWCLGWSTFFLLTAQPLFMSADPSQQDADWLLFQQGDYTTLFQQKSNLCSHAGLDFIFRHLQIEPKRRMSMAETLEHPWLSDPKILPVLAPKELLPESVRKLPDKSDAEAAGVKAVQPSVAKSPSRLLNSPDAAGAEAGARKHAAAGVAAAGQQIASSAKTSSHPELPSWTTANAVTHSANTHTPMVRMRSPVPTPRTSCGGIHQSRLPIDRRRGVNGGVVAKSPYVVATMHSPSPQGRHSTSSAHMTPGVSLRSAIVRAASPLGGFVDGSAAASPAAVSAMRPARPSRNTAQSPHQQDMPQTPAEAQQSRPQFMTPRASSRVKHSSLAAPPAAGGNPKAEPAAEGDERQRGRTWTFKPDAAMESLKWMGVEALPDASAARYRGVSPVPGTVSAAASKGAPTGMNAVAPGAGAPPQQKIGHSGNAAHFVAAQGRHLQSPTRSQGAVYVPRSPSPAQQGSVQSTSYAPVAQVRQLMRTPSPIAVPATTSFSWSHAPATFSPRAGFAWSPEPASPHKPHMRAHSPQHYSPRVSLVPGQS